MRSLAVRLALGALGLAGLSAAYVKYAQTRDPVSALPAVGSALPAFSFPLLGGEGAEGRLSPAALAGHPAVLVSWSSTCRFSRQALGGLERLRAEYEPRGVRVVIVAEDGDAGQMRRFADSAGVRLPIALSGGRGRLLSDPEAWSRLTAQASFPKFLVVDGRGQVVHRTAGVAWGDTAGLEHPFPGLRAVLDSLAGGGNSGPKS